MQLAPSSLRQQYEQLEDNAKDIYNLLYRKSEENPNWYQESRP